VSAETDRQRQEELQQLFERHRSYLEYLTEGGHIPPLGAILGRTDAIARTISQHVDLSNPRDLELFLLGGAFITQQICEVLFASLQPMLGDAVIGTLIGGASIELASLCEALAVHLPQVRRDN
jgi:hypothetical protein